MKQNKTKQTNKKGFSLVEILFSLAVISLVIGYGISQMSGANEAALLADMKYDIRAAIVEQEAAKI